MTTKKTRRSRFNYLGLNGLININTLCPNGEYYYRLQSPEDINMGNYGGKIAFYHISGRLLYHRNDCISHSIPPWEKIEFVRWSEEGNMAYFYEYRRNEIYHIVFLDFHSSNSFRLDQLNDKEHLLLNDLIKNGKNYNEDEIRKTLTKHDIQKASFYIDEIIKPTIMQMIFRKTRWHPRI